MKKEYIKPELIEEFILVESALLGGSIDTDTPANPDIPAQGNGRRGSWGNLWDEE